MIENTGLENAGNWPALIDMKRYMMFANTHDEAQRTLGALL